MSTRRVDSSCRFVATMHMPALPLRRMSPLRAELLPMPAVPAQKSVQLRLGPRARALGRGRVEWGGDWT
eukprot:scaffold140612_cov211-Phaeocystis_antarctica.AAC.1